MIRFLVQAFLLTVVFISACARWREAGKICRQPSISSMLVIGSLETFVYQPTTQAHYEDLHEFRFMLDLAAFGRHPLRSAAV